MAVEPEIVYECRKHFFRKDNNSGCEPSCETWSLYGEEKTWLLRITIVVHDLIALVSLVVVLILYAFQYKAL